MESKRGFPVKARLKLRDKLVAALSRWVGRELTAAEWDRVEMMFIIVAKLRGPSEEAFRRGAASWRTEAFTASRAKYLAWRVAGNLGSLKAGRPIPPPDFSQTAVGERPPRGKPVPGRWIPFEIIAARGDGDAYEVAVRGLLGSVSAIVFRQRGSYRWFRRLSRTVGFDPRKRKQRLRAAADLVGAQFFGYVEPSRVTASFVFRRTEATAGMRKDLRVLTLKRRLRERVCPYGWTVDDVPCSACPGGVEAGVIRCDMAPRPVNLVRRDCRRCGKSALFDLVWSKTACIECCAQKGV